MKLSSLSERLRRSFNNRSAPLVFSFFLVVKERWEKSGFILADLHYRGSFSFPLFSFSFFRAWSQRQISKGRDEVSVTQIQVLQCRSTIMRSSRLFGFPYALKLLSQQSDVGTDFSGIFRAGNTLHLSHIYCCVKGFVACIIKKYTS